MQLPAASQYRIWLGQCAKAEGALARPCPLSTAPAPLPGAREPRRDGCKDNLNDHFAFTYVMKLQDCVLRSPIVQANSCIGDLLRASM
jgi:hypothetical protein